MIDILILNGMVVDGSGAPAQKMNIAVQADRIMTIEPGSDLYQAQAERVIDAAGKVVAPGFIDMHSHGDYVLPYLPTADSKVHQGVTLEVVGNCGESMAPLNPEMQREKIAETPYQVECPADWLTFGEFIERLERQGTSLNVAPLVGHGTIRKKVMGMTDAPPTPEQLRKMQAEVAIAMDEGAIGLSTGLIYTPSMYASPAEITALARTAAGKGGIYTSHIRGEGNTLMEAIREAVDVARATGIRTEISHLKASGVKNWHKMPQAIAAIEAARSSGLDVSADMYPYNASNTDLSSLLPGWVHVGGRAAMLARLQDPAERERVKTELADAIDANGVDWDQIYISSAPGCGQYEGRHLQDIATEKKLHPWDAVMDVLLETHLNAEIVEFTMHPENVAMGLQQPFVAICTDASGRAAAGPFSIGKPHPRNYGSFPRVLGKYVREDHIFSLEEAIRKMTSLPAGKLGVLERGLLEEGYYADLVIFDPQTIADTATFTDPHCYPTGIEWVIVNGDIVIENGNHTGARPGRVVS